MLNTLLAAAGQYIGLADLCRVLSQVFRRPGTLLKRGCLIGEWSIPVVHQLPRLQRRDVIPMRKILLVEDDPDLAQLVSLQLQDIDVECRWISNGREALESATTEHYDMLMLDVMLPEVDGLEICRTVRSVNRHIPIMMVTAKVSEIDRVLGLELGADDYITKPFSTMELLARVKALLRRASVADSVASDDDKPAQPLAFKELKILEESRRVYISEKEIDLTPKEYDLLHHFITNPGRVFSRMDLLDKVWGYQYEGYHHTVNSHINRLRTKVEKNPAEPEYILTRWGVGYEFATE